MAHSDALQWLTGSTRWICLQLLLLLVLLLGMAAPMSIVKTLPGYSGDLPFKLETGYVGVGDDEDIQLFYYFIESQRNPVRDPLLLWLTGGPGCSGLYALVYEVGPLSFDVQAFNGSFPTFVLNPYSWTKVANIIFLDAPVGTGFSYSTSQEGYYTSDTKSAQSMYDFLGKWLIDHPKFSTNPLYVTGDSYSGTIIPIVVTKMTKALEAGDKLFKNLQGYMIGNPITAVNMEINSRVEYAYRMTLISNELYKSVKASCNGSYVDVDDSNVDCIDDLQLFIECTVKINQLMILEPKCSFATPKERQLKWDASFGEDISIETLVQSPERKELWCRNSNYVLSYMWANDPNVQAALNVRNGTITDWKRCNQTLVYDYDVVSAVEYHRYLSTKAYRAFIYSGDHDMAAPYLATQRWINNLNLTTVDDWRPWFVEGQIAGERVTQLQNTSPSNVLKWQIGGFPTTSSKIKSCFLMSLLCLIFSTFLLLDVILKRDGFRVILSGLLSTQLALCDVNQLID